VTTPRYFKDNKAGLPYLFGEHLPAANASNIETALRRAEKAAYLSMVQNWTVSSVGGNYDVAVYDATVGLWAFAKPEIINLGVLTSGPSLNGAVKETIAVPAIDVPGPQCGASSDLGCYVIGLAATGATASKILQSNNGTTWAARTIGAVNTDPVVFVEWEPANARFVALVNSGQVHTSPDGVTWTSRTVPVGLAAAVWTGLAISATGMCVVTASGTTNYMTSADGGITWVQRTGPTNGAAVTHAPGVNFGSGGFAWGTSYVSSDGISWSAMTTAPRGSSQGTCKLYGIGPMFVAVTEITLSTTFKHAYIEFSFDQANPSSWTYVAGYQPDVGDQCSLVRVFRSKNQVLVSCLGLVGSVYVSHSLGY